MGCYKVRKYADQRIKLWQKQGLEPLFTVTGLAECMECLGYEMDMSEQGNKRKGRMLVLDERKPLTLGNLSVFVKVNDKQPVKITN